MIRSGTEGPAEPGDERVRLATPEGPGDSVQAAVARPRAARTPGVLLTPGAGGDLDGAGLVALASAVADAGHPVVRANLPHREAGRRVPPRAEASVPAVRSVLAAARDHLELLDPWVVGGKSYGGRVASLAVAEGTRAAGLLFYGYPLHPPGRPDRPRVAHWPTLDVPCLFLQGDRDPFCDLDQLHRCLDALAGPVTLHVVAGGDHSLRVARAHSPIGRVVTEQETIRGVGGLVAEWLEGLRPQQDR